ncbi:hypothetical protein H6F89_14040 [Cyanobacteria bacterium FACHB-63]|nr:hypothetical protein [Cyanobacteria bacterium FACHB-63]
MWQWINRTVQEISRELRGSTFKLIVSMGGFLILWGVFAPVSTIVWWLNQNAESLGWVAAPESKPVSDLPQSASGAKIDCYIVFLPGVGNFSPDEITAGEKHFLDRLVEQHRSCVAVKDIFPYSVANRDLGSERVFRPLWKLARDNDELLGSVLIPLRNLWRFAISSDYRYSPVYSMGIADTIVDRMNAVHPISKQRINLILISTSGGAQVALGATPYLADWLNARLTVVSIGGAFDGKAGFDYVDHVYHFQGQSDLVPTLSYVLFPSRWHWTVGSPINQAFRQGRFTVCSSGSHEHSGDKGYFGTAIALNNRPYVEQTIDQVTQLPIWSLDQSPGSQCPQRSIQ